jgi:hypothetical protein
MKIRRSKRHKDGFSYVRFCSSNDLQRASDKMQNKNFEILIIGLKNKKN